MSLSIRSTCDVRKLSTADPNLLPFHIAHTGPAPVSTYFLTQPAKEVVGAPEGSKTTVKEASPAADTTAEADSTAEAHAPATTDEADAPATTDEAKASATINAPTADLSTAASSGSTTDPAITSHPSKRLVSSFRGRTVHGLRVDVPPGYLGVVLRADGQPATFQPRDTRPQKRGRRSAAAAEEGEGDAMLADDDAIEDTRPSRILNPASQFSSFMVWGADIPVDEGRDDYIRALTEWTALAGEIHRTD
ncbi:ribonuclease H2, subunit C [Schizophyllum commune]